MGGEKSLEAWGFVRKVLADLTEHDHPGRARRTRAARRPAGTEPGHRPVHRTVRRHRPRPSALRRHVHAVPVRGRAEPARLLPAGDDQRRPRLPGHRIPRHVNLSRAAGAGRHRDEPAPDEQLPVRPRTRARRRRPLHPRLLRGPPRRQRPRRGAVGADPRRRHLDRGARLHRRPGHRNPCAAAHLATRPIRSADTAHRRDAGRPADRHGVDDRQADHPAPHRSPRPAGEPRTR